MIFTYLLFGPGVAMATTPGFSGRWAWSVYRVLRGVWHMNKYVAIFWPISIWLTTCGCIIMAVAIFLIEWWCSFALLNSKLLRLNSKLRHLWEWDWIPPLGVARWLGWYIFRLDSFVRRLEPQNTAHTLKCNQSVCHWTIYKVSHKK